MTKFQIIPQGTVNQMFLIKNELINLLKGIVKEKPLTDVNIPIFENNTGKKLVIKDVYLDQLEGKLSIRTEENERKAIENALEENSEDMESIILSISELTKIISYVENMTITKETAKATIIEMAKEFGFEITLK